MDLQVGDVIPVPLSAYNHTEYGYLASVTCGKNGSAACEVSYVGEYGVSDISVNLWSANGTLPNSVPGSLESYSLNTYPTSNNIFSSSSVVNDGKHIIAVASNSGSWYEQGDKMRCSVEFRPKLFAVAANITTKTITVTPVDTISGYH